MGRMDSRGGWWRAAGGCALLSIVLLAWAGVAQTEDEGTEKGDKRPARTRALLIGCAEYPAIAKQVTPEVYAARVRLRGCVNDVRMLAKTLVERMGVAKADITVLASDESEPTRQPTGANIRRELETLAKHEYQAGDRVFVHYSGHGVQVPDDNGDEIDGLDEAWLVADARIDPKTAYAGTMRDESLGGYLRAIRARGARVWCVMDCCHSATGMRGTPSEPVRVRGIDPSTLGVELVPAATRGLGSAREETRLGGSTKQGDGLVVFYAAQSFQEVPEVRLPKDAAKRTSYGLLTASIVRALERSGNQMTFGELYEQIVAGYRDFGHHHIVQPYAEGDMGQLVFGGSRAVEVPLFVRNVGQRPLELSAGAVHGIAEGTELDVFEAGHAGNADKRLGTVEVTRVGPVSSELRAMKREDNVWARTKDGRWPAVVSKFVLGDTSLPLAIVDEAEKPVPLKDVKGDAKEVLADELMKQRFPVVADPAKATWVLVVDGERKAVSVRPAARSPGAPAFDARQGLEATLLTIFRGENLLRLTGRDARAMRFPRNVSLQVDLKDPSGARTPVRSGQRVAPGSILELGLRKEKARGRGDARTVDVFAFWVDPHYGVWLLYPSDGQDARLTHEDVTPRDRPIPVGYEDGEFVSDESQGLERIVVFAAPRRDDAPKLDLRFLEQKPLEVLRRRGAGDAGSDPTAKLLGELAFGSAKTRGRAQRVDVRETPLYMQVFTFRSGWNPLRAPAQADGAPAVRHERAATRALPGKTPDAWDIRGDVGLGQAGADDAWCLLTARDGETTHVLLDLDKEVEASSRTQQGLSALLEGRSFDAEVALRIDPRAGRTTVWYDTDNDGAFDLVLVDTDGDQRASERHRKTGEDWTHETGVDLLLFSTAHLTWIGTDGEARRRAIERMGALSAR